MKYVCTLNGGGKKTEAKEVQFEEIRLFGLNYFRNLANHSAFKVLNFHYTQAQQRGKMFRYIVIAVSICMSEGIRVSSTEQLDVHGHIQRSLIIELSILLYIF